VSCAAWQVLIYVFKGSLWGLREQRPQKVEGGSRETRETRGGCCRTQVSLAALQPRR